MDFPTKFREGDKVVCIKKQHDDKFTIGQTYEVQNYRPKGSRSPLGTMNLHSDDWTIQGMHEECFVLKSEMYTEQGRINEIKQLEQMKVYIDRKLIELMDNKY